MNTIKLDGQEYILRCDLNVLEKIHKKHGSIDKIDIRDIESIKEITAWMINEHFYYIGDTQTVTPGFIGAHSRGADVPDIITAITKEIIDCIQAKN